MKNRSVPEVAARIDHSLSSWREIESSASLRFGGRWKALLLFPSLNRLMNSICFKAQILWQYTRDPRRQLCICSSTSRAAWKGHVPLCRTQNTQPTEEEEEERRSSVSRGDCIWSHSKIHQNSTLARRNFSILLERSHGSGTGLPQRQSHRSATLACISWKHRRYVFMAGRQAGRHLQFKPTACCWHTVWPRLERSRATRTCHTIHCGVTRCRFAVICLSIPKTSFLFLLLAQVSCQLFIVCIYWYHQSVGAY